MDCDDRNSGLNNGYSGNGGSWTDKGREPEKS